MADGVVYESVNRFLEDALLIAENDFRGVDSLEFQEAVVAVDDAAIEVVHIGSGIAASFEGDHGPETGRDDRYPDEEHPFRTDLGFDHLLTTRD